MTCSVYNTPRAMLIRCLEEAPSKTAHWIDRMNTILIRPMMFKKLWFASQEYRYPSTMLYDSGDDAFCFLTSTTYENLDSWHEGIEGKIVTRSDQKRSSIVDLKKADLYQWIIQLLCELTRVDWIQYTNKNELEFEILDMKGMGEMYSKVNGIKTGNGVYNMKLLLSSYCMTGLLIKTGSHTYRFEREWYFREIQRSQPIPTMKDLVIEFFQHRAMFPELCRDVGFRSRALLVLGGGMSPHI